MKYTNLKDIIQLNTVDSDTTYEGSPCWVWRRWKTTQGYGGVMVAGKRWTAHRLAYELWKGPIPEGLQLDHLCRVRACCNPAHLEAVTGKENIRRGDSGKATGALIKARWERATHCKAGHERTPENFSTYTTKKGNTIRQCLACRRERRKVKGGPGVGSYWRSKTHCKGGHPFNEINTYLTPKGNRVCRQCQRDRREKGRLSRLITGQ